MVLGLTTILQNLAVLNNALDLVDNQRAHKHWAKIHTSVDCRLRVCLEERSREAVLSFRIKLSFR